jgi:hypothetical protein
VSKGRCGELPKSPGHPFYTRLNALLEADNFDRFVEGQCAKFYAPVMGRSLIVYSTVCRVPLLPTITTPYLVHFNLILSVGLGSQ